jgi:voltage-gated potassium channel
MHDHVTPALETWRRRTDTPLLILAIGSLPLLLLELDRDRLAHGDRVFLDVMNIAVLVAFATDYVVEFVVARGRRSYMRREWSSLGIVLAQAVALVPALAGFGVLRVLRAGRVWRALAVVGRVVAVGGAATSEGRSVLRRHAAGFALGLAGLTWITAAVAFTLAEDVGEGRRVGSFFDSVWWASSTITTVGYGDIYPVTTAGRLVGMVTMLVGIATFAVVTAKLGEFLIRAAREDEAGLQTEGVAD